MRGEKTVRVCTETQAEAEAEVKAAVEAEVMEVHEASPEL